MPACDAVILHVPVDKNAVGVQMDAVVELKVTARPEVAVAAKLGVAPNVWLPGLVKVIVCDAAATVNDCVTGPAAE